MSLGTNAALLSVGSYVAQGASAAAYLVAARHLDPAGFGMVLAALGIVLVLASSADFGLNAWTVRRLAARDAASAFTETASAKIVLALALGGVWIFLVFLVAGSSYHWVLSLLGVYLSLSILNATVAVPFRAFERMKIVASVTALEKLVGLGCIVVLFGVGFRDAAALPLALTIGSATSLAAYSGLLDKEYRAVRITSWRGVLGLWRASVGFGIFGLAAYIQRIDTAIVAIFAGPASAGTYGAPARLSTLLGVLPSSFSLAMFSRISGDTGRNESRRDSLVSGSAMFVLLIGLLTGVFLFAPQGVAILVGPNYEGSVPVLRIYILAVALTAVSQPLAALLQAENDEAFTARLLVVADLVGLSAIASGAYLAGAAGAAVGMVLLQFVIALGLTFRVRRLRARRLPPELEAGGVAAHG